MLYLWMNVFSLLLSSHKGSMRLFFSSGLSIFVAVVAFLLGSATAWHPAKSIWVTLKRLWKPEQQNEAGMEKRSSRKERLTCDVWAQLILFSTLSHNGSVQEWNAKGSKDKFIITKRTYPSCCHGYMGLSVWGNYSTQKLYRNIYRQWYTAHTRLMKYVAANDV